MSNCQLPVSIPIEFRCLSNAKLKLMGPMEPMRAHTHTHTCRRAFARWVASVQVRRSHTDILTFITESAYILYYNKYDVFFIAIAQETTTNMIILYVHVTR